MLKAGHLSGRSRVVYSYELPGMPQTMNSIDEPEEFSFTSLPKVIGPKGHAIIDYALFATTVTTAYLFGRKNRVIGVSTLLTAVIEGVNVAVTDFPGGLVKELSFPAHGRMGLGTLPVFAALPALMGFAKRRESLFFYGQVALAAAVIGSLCCSRSQHPGCLADSSRRSGT
jgi:hypothetical protein